MTGRTGAPPSGAAAGSWLTPGRFALLLAGLICAAYPDVVFGGRVFYFRDFGFFGYPLAHHHHQSFWRGEVPLWNPLNNCGLPFLAQWNTLVLYPGSLFYLLFPPAWTLTFFCLVHLWLAGMGMYFLAWHWLRNRLGAAVAGVAFALNGLSLNSLMWPAVVAALGWMPFVVLLAERAVGEGGRWWPTAAVVGAVQMLSGAPEIILCTWLVVGCLTFVHILCGSGSRGVLGLRLAALVGTVAALAAAQLLPFIDLFHHSQRGPAFADSTWAMPATGWANFLVPLFHTTLSRQGVFYQEGQYWTSSYYLGISVFCLACLSVGGKSAGRYRMLAALGLAGMVLALGPNSALYAWLRGGLPQLGSMRYPVKFVFLVSFVAPLLAGFSIRRLTRPSGSDQDGFRTRAAIMYGVCVLVVGLLLWYDRVYPATRENVEATLRNGLARVGFLTAVLGFLWARPLFPSLRAGRWDLLLLICLGFDVLTHMPRQNPTVPQGALDPGLPVFQKLTPRPEPGRSRLMLSRQADDQLRHGGLSKSLEDYLASRQGLFSDCNLLENLPKINGFFPLFIREAAVLSTLIYESTNRVESPLLDFMTVSQETAPGSVFEWRARPDFMPFATFGQKPVFAPLPTILREIIAPQFLPRQVVFMEETSRRPGVPPGRSEGTVEQRLFGAQRIEFEVNATQPGFLVIAQSYYPRWSAYCDGARVSLLRCNYAFQAVALPAGSHRVRLAYEDAFFRAGMFVSALGLGACCLGWVMARRGIGARERRL